MTEYDCTREKIALFDTTDRGKLELTGADAVKFLHNLCTNDILNLAVGFGREAFLCTAKAKTVAHLLVYRAPDALWLDTAARTADKVSKHLDHYLISERVEIADRTADFAQFHLAGPAAHAGLAHAAVVPVPELAELQHLHITLGGTDCFVRRHSPLAIGGYDVLCPQTAAEVVKSALLGAGAVAASAATYNVLRIEAGTPVYGVDVNDERFVVEVDRITQAICYTKGCFLGQEPIVMARDRGHVNRMFRGLRLSGDGPVAAGTPLLHNGAEVGQVTSSVVSPRLGPIALAYVRRGSWEPGASVEAAGRTAEVVALPFGG